MYETKEQRIIAGKYESELLDIIDHAEDFTRSDLQGDVMALVRNISHNEGLLDFETRLTRSKAQDLQ
jgi:hypothetical protein